MSVTSQSFSRVGGELALGSSSSFAAAAVLGDGRIGAVSLDASAPSLELRFVGGSSGAAAPVDVSAGPAGAGVTDAEVTALAGGGAVVTWLSAYSHGPQAHYAVVGASGQLLASATVSAASATGIEAIALPDGGFDLGVSQSDLSGANTSLILQGFDAAGAATAAQSVFNAGGQSYHDLQGVLTAGGPELFWDNASGVHAALIGSGGAVQAFDLAAGTADGLQALQLADGHTALAWAAPAGSGSDILTATIDPTSGPLAAPVTVATAAGVEGSGQHLGLAPLQDGGYAVSWRPDGSSDASAAAVGADGSVAAAVAGVGDLIGADASGSLHAVTRHDGQAWADVYGSSSGGGSDPAGSAAPGQTITAPDDSGTALTGGDGNDVLIASHGADVLTGGGGSDAFTYDVIPWSAGHVTDFTPGVDVLDLSGLFHAAGYAGSDPVADGYLTLADDGSGGTKVWFDPDGTASGTPWPYLITDLDHVAPASLTVGQDVIVSTSGTQAPSGAATDGSASGGADPTGPASTGSGAGSSSAAGQTIAAPDDSGSALTGGDGNDVLIASHGADVLTGGGGADAFTFPVIPWSAGQVTDFTPGVDVLDLRPLFQAAGYAGSDPIADGHLSFGDDGSGGTKVWFDPDGTASGTPWPYLITDLDHVAPTALQAGHDWLFH